MTKFYIIRHGQTLFNERERVQGWCDSPLTENGQAQMMQLARGLKEVPFAAIYSSTAPRARTCADILGRECGQEVIPVESFREIGYGSLEGEYFEDAFPQGNLNPAGYAQFDGEDLYTALQRCISQMQEIAARYPDENVAIMTHGHLIKTLLGNFDSRFSAETVKAADLIPNCSVTILTHDNEQFVLDSLPDISWRTDIGCAEAASD